MEGIEQLLRMTRRRQWGICCRCGAFIEVFTVRLHYKDGDRTNYDPDNLQAICRGCYNRLVGQRERQAEQQPTPIVSWRF